MGETMEAYYDKERKIWVFPGEDPAEVAAPLQAPPKNPSMGATPSPASKAEPRNDDPLAAMMAPPKRGPRAKPGVRPSPSSMPVMFPPGMMSPASQNYGGTAPKIAVFQPKPSTDDGKKENDEPRESD